MTIQKNRNYNEGYLQLEGRLLKRGEDYFWRGNNTTEIVVLIRNKDGKYSIKI